MGFFFSSSIFDSSAEPGLRLILLGPTGSGQTSVAHTLLGITDRKSPLTPVMESTKLSAVVNGREVTLIHTPDLLGPSLGDHRRATEALRSLLLVSPGPHAILMTVEAPGSISKEINQDPTRAIQGTIELFGDEVQSYIIPVLTHSGRQQTVDELLDQDKGDLRRAVTLCGQMPELVDIRSDCPLEVQKMTCRQLLGRVTEIKKLRGHFVHELQRRQEHFREDLLTDMSSSLANKLGHM
uniref:AIG1-type G domain-containing protein n=1 Tax=Cynoglossus semilaevis TaxID=244447 RepID=A0A3P8WWU3_CYNSE